MMPLSAHSRHRSKRHIASPWRRGLMVLLTVVVGVVAIASSAIAQAVLQRNDEGPGVSQLQRDLQSANLYDGPITGFYGDLTEQAVIQLQIASRLQPDGVFGPLTQSALSRRLRGSTTIPDVPRVGTLIPIDDPIDQDSGDLSGRLAVGTSNASCASFISSSGGAGLGTLQRGDAGTGVRQLQQRLDDLGYNPGIIDGVFGANTEAAVRQFQRDQGIVADGVVGGSTAQRLGLSDDDIEVGQPEINRGPYAVVVPAGRDDLDALATARLEQEDACFARSRLGSYIYAGGFPTRDEAESESLRLRALGLDARVDFRRRVRAN